MLFQEFAFEVIIKPGKLNMGPDHLSQLKSSEVGGLVDDQLPDVNLFRVEAMPDYLEDIALFLATGKCPEEYIVTQRRHMVVGAANYQWIVGQLYKMGLRYCEGVFLIMRNMMYYGNAI